MSEALPIDAVLDGVAERLDADGRLILVAAPGAGKTTRVPPRLAAQAPGRVLVLQPRRVAARSAAARVAEEQGWTVGQAVGYQIRGDARVSKATKVAFLTEGILTQRLQSDPSLEGVSHVVLDEFHERSIHVDLALAMLKEVQESLRPDLKILVMSATLETAPLVRYLEGAAVIDCPGRSFPLSVQYASPPRAEPAPVPEQVAGLVRRALDDGASGVLAFLPGRGEIERTHRALTARALDVPVLALHGQMGAGDQAAALRPSGARRVILATNVAETSLTIPDVDAVVDSGLHRVARFDPATGSDRLIRIRISQKNAAQRAGRAARTGPGRVYRAWTEKEQAHLPLDPEPEVARVNLLGPLLQALMWGAPRPEAFPWFEAPPSSGMIHALEALVALRLVTLRGDRVEPTELGRRVAAFPADPRLALLVLTAAAHGAGAEGARRAAVHFEGVRGRDHRDTVADCDLADRWARLAADAPAVRRRVEATAARWQKRLPDPPPTAGPEAVDEAVRRAVLAAYRDRVAQRDGDRYRLCAGGAARLSPKSVVREAAYVAVLALRHATSARGLEIETATRVEPEWLDTEVRDQVRFDAATASVQAESVVAYGQLVLRAKPQPDPDPEAVRRVLLDAARPVATELVPWTDACEAWAARAALIRAHTDAAGHSGSPPVPALDRERLWQAVEAAAYGLRSFRALQALDPVACLTEGLSHGAREAFRRLTPTHLTLPSGRAAPVQYRPSGPVVAAQLQELFGLAESPRILGGRVPVTVEILAPNRRPVQTTQDLANFWAETYQAVRKELRGRYPKHQWPEDPSEGIPTTRAKPARKTRK